MRRVDSSLVRELLVARPGRRYSQDELFQSQQNLYRVRSLPLRVGQHRLGRRSSPAPIRCRSWCRSTRASGAGSGAAWAMPPTTASVARWAGPRATSWAAAGILDLTSRVSKVGVGDPLDWGLADNICSASRRRHGRVVAKLNYYLGASVRRPAFLSPNNAVTVVGVHRAALRVQGVPAAGDRHQHRAHPQHAAPPQSRFRSPTPSPMGGPRPRR